MKFRNLMVIGTSHIAPESIQEVDRVINDEKPGIVALELDPPRLHALLSKKKQKLSLSGIRRIGFKGWLFSVIGAWVENRLGGKVGVSPGSEMLHAYRLASQHSLAVALIDQDIEVTLKRFSKEFSWRERWRLFVDIVRGFVWRKQQVEFSLKKVPSQKVISKLIHEVKKRYPNLYRVLVEERNEHMAKRLAFLMKKHPEKSVLAVVGAGHEQEILVLVKKYINRIDIV
jgi:pheromone shutdown-related protein TraB